MNKEQIYKEVLTEIQKVKPYVKDMVSAFNRYDQSPSIKTGSIRQNAKVRLYEMIELTAKHVWDNWTNRYSAVITNEEMIDIIHKAIGTVTFSDDEEYQCWKGLFKEGK